jgi:hypothetical protein
MTGKTLVVGNGVHLPPLIQEIFVPNSRDQSLGILGIISEHPHTLVEAYEFTFIMIVSHSRLERLP